MSHSPDPVDNQTIDHTESAPIAEPVKTQVNSQIPSPAFAETVGYDPSNAVPTQRIEPDAIIADRYQLLTEIARGGMGVVYSARDSKLNREVAVKFLLERISLQSQSARRFFEEAQIAAQLQHPGIAPVHDMGILVDGRPFLAMKLIKGKTLALILSQEKPDLFSLTELLANIVKTMAYVHSKGVIHRDLKPSNIMVGAFGEIQIMDWGLAKTLSSEPTSNTALTSNVPDSVSIVETERTPESMTQAGSILGTPAYMPPEQAKGDIDHTDTRSDVFALGAILCEMLTGKPAYVADTFDEIRAQSIIGHTQPALERLAKCGADEELIDLASRCLSPNPANRPTDAAAVAKSIDAYRTNVSERLRRAEQERASAEIRIAEQSKRRKLLLSVGCLLGLASIAFLIYQNLQNRQLEKQTIVAKEAQAEALKAKSESDHLAQMAQRRLEKAVQAVETVITRVAGEKWALKPELQEERKEALVDAVAFFNGLGSEDSQDPIVQRQAARANLFASSAMISLAEYDQSEVAARTAAKLYRSIQADSPHDSSALRGEADAITLLGHINAIRAQFADALRNYQSALETAERAVKLEPDRNENQLAIANCCSALALFYSFQMPDRARENHLRALAIGEKLCQQPQPEFNMRLVYANALVNLAITEMNGAGWAKSLSLIERAREQVRLLDNMKPPTSRSAETFYLTKAGLDIYEGLYQIRSKNLDKGLALIQSGIAMFDRLLKIQPKSFPFQIQSLQVRVVYLQALLSAGKTEPAEKTMQEIAIIQKRLVESNPQLTWVKLLGQMQHTLLIIQRIRQSYSPDFEVDAEKINREFGNNALMKYNVACIFAQASKYAAMKDQNRFAERSMTLLHELLASSDYFDTMARLNHLNEDTDLDPLRTRPDFREFEKKVKEHVTHRKKESPGRNNSAPKHD